MLVKPANGTTRKRTREDDDEIERNVPGNSNDDFSKKHDLSPKLDNKANADSGEDLDDPLVRLSAVRSCIADYSVVEDMEAFSAEDALTCVLAFYKVCVTCVYHEI